MNRNREDVCRRAEELGNRYEVECTGCAQSTVAAIFDALGEGSDEVFRAASGLADGIGLTGNGTCGALVGGALAVSWFTGRRREDFQDMMAAMPSYLACRELHDAFMAKYDCCRCHDLQTKVCGRAYNFWEPGEIEQALEDGAMKHCAQVVGTAARLAVEIILKADENRGQE
ncbi:MAG: C_GCAxxG_C_C family protein [Deltaproteobacteria bacterium]|nr:C_GCAxxG_C_C family protein [Deltaproteobacteria bacterium]